MKSAVFNTANEAYQVSHISYAGPVHEIPEKSRKGESTHSFKMITSLGVAYCYYRSQETASKARGVLSAMFQTVKPRVFTYRGETIDPESVVSFTAVYELKELKDGFSHAFTVSLKATDDKNPRLCLRFKTLEAAKNSRKALWAAINAVNGLSFESTVESGPLSQPVENTDNMAKDDDLPF